MSTETGVDELRVVRAEQCAGDTAQTTGMIRRAGVSAATTGAERLWLGRVTVPAGVTSGAHHHGESESGIYIISGHARFSFGEGYRRQHDVGPGDFVFVPPHVPHVETNLSADEPVEMVVARSTQEGIVVNLDGSGRPGAESARRLAAKV